MALPGVPISVDDSRGNLGVSHFLLTHMHTDHLRGLKDGWDLGTIYCTTLTRELLLDRYRIEAWRVEALDFGETKFLKVRGKGRGNGEEVHLDVTVLDARHCPGSAMFLLRGSFGCILHTGDFRFSSDDMLDGIGDKRIDLLVMDNTYCNPAYNFPSQADAGEEVLRIVREHHTHSKRILIGVDSLGKEDLLVMVSREVGAPLLVSKERLHRLAIIGCPMDAFTADNTSRWCVRVMERWRLTRETVEHHNKLSPTIGIIPSGWAAAAVQPGAGATAAPPGGQLLFRVPYSLHSSFSELRRFVALVRPGKMLGILKGQDLDVSQALGGQRDRDNSTNSSTHTANTSGTQASNTSSIHTSSSSKTHTPNTSASRVRHHHDDDASPVRHHHDDNASRVRHHHDDNASRVRHHHDDDASRVRHHHDDNASRVRHHHDDDASRVRHHHDDNASRMRHHHDDNALAHCSIKHAIRLAIQRSFVSVPSTPSEQKGAGHADAHVDGAERGVAGRAGRNDDDDDDDDDLRARDACARDRGVDVTEEGVDVLPRGDDQTCGEAPDEYARGVERVRGDTVVAEEHQNGGKMHQNGGKIHQNGGKMHNNGGKIHQNGGKMHQNGGKHERKMPLFMNKRKNIKIAGDKPGQPSMHTSGLGPNANDKSNDHNINKPSMHTSGLGPPHTCDTKGLGGLGVAHQVGDSAGYVGASAGHVGASAGHVGASAGHVGANAGHVGASAGHVGASAGHVGASAGHVGAGKARRLGAFSVQPFFSKPRARPLGIVNGRGLSELDANVMVEEGRDSSEAAGAGGTGSVNVLVEEPHVEGQLVNGRAQHAHVLVAVQECARMDVGAGTAASTGTTASLQRRRGADARDIYDGGGDDVMRAREQKTVKRMRVSAFK